MCYNDTSEEESAVCVCNTCGDRRLRARYSGLHWRASRQCVYVLSCARIVWQPESYIYIYSRSESSRATLRTILELCTRTIVESRRESGVCWFTGKSDVRGGALRRVSDENDMHGLRDNEMMGGRDRVMQRTTTMLLLIIAVSFQVVSGNLFGTNRPKTDDQCFCEVIRSFRFFNT